MDCTTIAQTVLDKALEVTFHKQHELLLEAFTGAGIQIGAGNKVAGATEASLEKVVGALGSTFPVAAITAKRTLAAEGVNA
jgi:hypothetical protein